MSSLIGQSTHEIGIRVVLGAQPSSMLSLILKRGVVLPAVGLGIGMAVSFVATRALTSLLYGIGTATPATFITVPLPLTTVALPACYIPARWATRIDLMVALRCE